MFAGRCSDGLNLVLLQAHSPIFATAAFVRPSNGHDRRREADVPSHVDATAAVAAVGRAVATPARVTGCSAATGMPLNSRPWPPRLQCVGYLGDLEHQANYNGLRRPRIISRGYRGR
jgi:hypothetical protein